MRLSLVLLLAVCALVCFVQLVVGSQCPDGSLCSDRSTCCVGSDGAYDCCPVYRAQCCSGGATCCPLGYQCSSDGASCVSDRTSHPMQATVGTPLIEPIEFIQPTPLEPPHAMLA